MPSTRSPPASVTVPWILLAEWQDESSVASPDFSNESGDCRIVGFEFWGAIYVEPIARRVLQAEPRRYHLRPVFLRVTTCVEPLVKASALRASVGITLGDT